MSCDEMYARDGVFTYAPHNSTMTLNSVVFALSLVTWYLRDDKNNALSIFIFSGSMQFSFHFN